MKLINYIQLTLVSMFAFLLGFSLYNLGNLVYINTFPLFEVGDCIALISESNEFEKSRVLSVDKILEIGKTHYRVIQIFPKYPDYIKISPEVKKFVYVNDNKKVNCEDYK